MAKVLSHVGYPIAPSVPPSDRPFRARGRLLRGRAGHGHKPTTQAPGSARRCTSSPLGCERRAGRAPSKGGPPAGPRSPRYGILLGPPGPTRPRHGGTPWSLPPIKRSLTQSPAREQGKSISRQWLAKKCQDNPSHQAGGSEHPPAGGDAPPVNPHAAASRLRTDTSKIAGTHRGPPGPVPARLAPRGMRQHLRELRATARSRGRVRAV
jgi:hypothetical protein